MWTRKCQMLPSRIGSHRVTLPPSALAASSSMFPIRVPWPVPPAPSAAAVLLSTLIPSMMEGFGIPVWRRPSAKRPPVDRGGRLTFLWTPSIEACPRVGSSLRLAPPRPPGAAVSKSKNSLFGSVGLCRMVVRFPGVIGPGMYPGPPGPGVPLWAKADFPRSRPTK
jgi:hypothetical protein